MKLVEILQGKWLGHPLHAALVHVPVGGWLFACAVDVCSWQRWCNPSFAGRLSLCCVGVGLVTVLAAVPTGLADWTAIRREKPAWKIALYHMLLNVGATVVWGCNFWLRLTVPGREVTPPIVATSVIGALLVLVSAYLGSLMVFDQGIGVARVSKKKSRAVAERAGARVPPAKSAARG